MPALAKRKSWKSIAMAIGGLCLSWLGFALTAAAQPPKTHQLYNSQLPPGAVGQMQLLRGGPRAGYFQPVELIPPEGGSVAVQMESGFQEAGPGPLRVGLLIGAVYRFKVTGIPGNEGLEVYPTIEVIDRLYPPPGLETRFPIPIELTRDELEYALDGKLVTRVIYLENPLDALPIREEPRKQSWFEVRPNQDPLHVADELGRPMAILRMGSRIPDAGETFAGRPAAPAIVLPRDEEPLHSFEMVLPDDARIELVPPAPAVPANP
jgi:hypothetical protein